MLRLKRVTGLSVPVQLMRLKGDIYENASVNVINSYYMSQNMGNGVIGYFCVHFCEPNTIIFDRFPFYEDQVEIME